MYILVLTNEKMVDISKRLGNRCKMILPHITIEYINPNECPLNRSICGINIDNFLLEEGVTLTDKDLMYLCTRLRSNTGVHIHRIAEILIERSKE